MKLLTKIDNLFEGADVLDRINQGIVQIPANDKDTIGRVTDTENYMIWKVPSEPDVVYAGTPDAWASRFLSQNESINEVSDKEIDAMTQEILTKPAKSAIQKNGKTGYSVDFSTKCRYAREGHPCPYCYVEIGRNGVRSFIRNLFMSGWDKEDIRQAISQKKYHKDAPEVRKELGGRKAGTHFVRPTHGKTIFDNAPYKGELLKWSEETINQTNSQGGLRLYANSDYGSSTNGIEWEDQQLTRLFDDADRVGVKVKAITKQPEFVKKWSDRTSVTDLSIDDLKTYGVPSNAIDISQAKALVKEHPKTKIRVVAFNPEEAEMYAKDPAISIITLFHGSPGKLPDEMEAINVVDMSHGTPAWKDAMQRIKALGAGKKVCASGSSGTCATCPALCGVKESKSKLLTTMQVVDEIYDKRP